MNIKNIICVCSFIFFVAPMSAEVIVTDNILDVLQTTKTCDLQNTLFVFDLDGTLIETKQMLGCDVWGWSEGRRHIDEAGDKIKGLENHYKNWCELIKKIDMLSLSNLKLIYMKLILNGLLLKKLIYLILLLWKEYLKKRKRRSKWKHTKTYFTHR